MAFNNASNDTLETVIPAACTCETCKLARYEDTELRGAVVHNYSYRPARWTLNAIRNDPHDYYVGVELETDNYKIDARGGRVISRQNNSIAADMARPSRLWVPKSDGSVSGPEFVSHPATLSYWHSKEAQLREMFKMLVHAGFRSHDNDNAGMHINISRNAFANRKHLFRFLTLIHTSPAWSMMLSQRTKSSADQWASLGYLRRNSSAMESECERIAPDENDLTAPSRYGSTHRYQALNAPAGQPRFEFRLPRGTLRIDRFYKNIEWTVAMIEYTRAHSFVAECKPMKFMKWVVQPGQRTMYPNLVNFLAERFENIIIVADSLPAGAAPDVTPVVVPTLAESVDTFSDALSELVTRIRATSAATAATSGVRISPRTGRPVRSYTPRPGARRPGRPAGFSPRITQEQIEAEINDTTLRECCGLVAESGWYCERRNGHSGRHAANGASPSQFDRMTTERRPFARY